MSGLEVIIPALMAAAPTISAIGAAVSAVGLLSQADAQRKAANNNADLKNAAAAETSRQATLQIEQQRTRARSVIGQQLASTAESGTGLNGSNLDLLQQSLTNNELDSLNIRHGANLNAAGLTQQAGMDRAYGSNAQTGGYFSAAGTLLNGGASYLRSGSVLPGPTYDPYGNPNRMAGRP